MYQIQAGRLAALAFLGAAVLVLAATTASAQTVPSQLEAVFSLNGGRTGPLGEWHYPADLERLDGSPEVLLEGVTISGAGTPFIDFEGTAYPAGEAAGFETPGDMSGEALVIFNPSNHLFGYELSFDYKTNSMTRASFGYRYADEPVFTSGQAIDFIPDGQWHRVTRDALFVQNRPAVFGIGPNGTTTPGSLLFDNFQLVALPEPGAVSLLVAPCVALLWRRR